MSGLWLPPGTQTPGSIAASELIPEVEKLAAWVRAWPRQGEPPVTVPEIAKLVIARAQTYLWDRHKCETILKLVISELGLEGQQPGKPPGKDRKGLKPVCNHAWENPTSRFLKCTTCGFMTVRETSPMDIASTSQPSRMTQTDPASLARNSSRAPTINTSKLKQRLPS